MAAEMHGGSTEAPDTPPPRQPEETPTQVRSLLLDVLDRTEKGRKHDGAARNAVIITALNSAGLKGNELSKSAIRLQDQQIQIDKGKSEENTRKFLTGTSIVLMLVPLIPGINVVAATTVAGIGAVGFG